MSSADERLALIRAKVERAEQHIQDLDVALRLFLDCDPYLTARQPHPERPDFMVYWLSGARPIPQSISLIAGDALTNLRAALDHLAYQLAVVNGTVDEKVLKTTYFPISDDATKIPGRSARKSKGNVSSRQRSYQRLRTLQGWE